VPVVPLVLLVPLVPLVLLPEPLRPPPGWPVPLAFELPAAAGTPVAVVVPELELPLALSPELVPVELHAASPSASRAPMSAFW
jgi:hypothetical protein